MKKVFIFAMDVHQKWIETGNLSFLTLEMIEQLRIEFLNAMVRVTIVSLYTKFFISSSATIIIIIILG